MRAREQGKSTSGWVFKGYKDSPMSTRNLSHFFKNHSTKALGEKRSSQLVFKDLRDSYNEIILDSNVNVEIKDILMGHLRKGSKASYSVSIASVKRVYQEEIFPKLSFNGWRLKQKASEVDDLRDELQNMRTALNQIESENTGYKTRIDNLQHSINDLMKKYQELDAIYRVSMNKLLDGNILNMPFDAIPTEEEVQEYIKKRQ